MTKLNVSPDAATGTTTAKRTMKFKTRFTHEGYAQSYLTLRVDDGDWYFRSRLAVNESDELRAYLKTDEFNDFAYSVFSKYEGLSYADMSVLYETDADDDFQKIWEKLDRFAYRRDEEEPFKVSMTVDKKGGYCRVVFRNNKDGRYVCRRYRRVSHLEKVSSGYENDLKADKRLMCKLAAYKTWDEFEYDFMKTNQISNVIDRHILAA